jgi:L-lactate dehydrogenase complex protein LldG
MSDAREEMLQRIRAALAHAPAEERMPARDYHQRGAAEREELVERFIERVTDYKAQVIATTEAELPTHIAALCAERGLRRLIAPTDVPDAWLPPAVEILRDHPPVSHETLDSVDGVLTGCRLGIAQTGTIVLDGGQYQGRRALSLVPDVHVCVVRPEQVVDLVPEAITALASDPTRPITFISGPSATSDIELNRVEGVHGPRTLIVFLLH